MNGRSGKTGGVEEKGKGEWGQRRMHKKRRARWKHSFLEGIFQEVELQGVGGSLQFPRLEAALSIGQPSIPVDA